MGHTVYGVFDASALSVAFSCIREIDMAKGQIQINKQQRTNIWLEHQDTLIDRATLK